MHARRLQRVPELQSAWEDGELSTGQVDIVLSMLRHRHVSQFARHEAQLVPLLAPLSITETTEAMVEWRRRADAVVDDAPDGRGSDALWSTLSQHFGCCSALVLCDQHCRFPGRDRPSHHCHAHHNRDARPEGRTSVDNLVLLCATTITCCTEMGWRWELEPDGTFHVVNPEGLRRTTSPPGDAATISERLVEQDIGPPLVASR